MTGTLRVKNGKYYCVLDYRDENGARKRKWINTKLDVKGNKKKATEILNKIILEYENKTDLEKSKSNNIFFTDYMLQWLEKKKNKVEITTWDGYYNTVVKHLVPYFEPLKLSLNDLKPKHVVDYYEYKFSSGRKDHKKGGLSMGSLKKHSVILKNILNNAFLEELINRNPALKIPLPKKENEESRCKFLNAKEANDLLKIFKEHRLQPLIYMTLYYGLRRSEVLGLKWSAVDFKNNTVEIKHTVVKNSTIVAKDKTKTAAGKRKYVLLPEIKEVLQNLKEETQQNKKIFGKSYIKSDYIFTWNDGHLYRPEYITREFQKVLAKNNFPKMRFHDLRHSCASILYDKGWEIKDIQTWLGHADIQTTANIYTHISKSRKNEMAKNLQNTFSL